VRSIPLAGKRLIIVAAVQNVLHFRIHDGDGNMAVDTDETTLTKEAGRIGELWKQLESLWPPHRLSENERVRISDAVISIVGYTVEQRLMAPEHKLARIVATTVLLFILASAALRFCLTG
jgi:hypothetical protein